MPGYTLLRATLILENFRVMQIESDRHFADDLLEKYSIGHLPEEQVPALEEHLFVCSDCQVRLSSIDEYVQVTKAAAAAELARAMAAPRPSFAGALLGRFWPIPKPVWALGLTFALLAAVLSVVNPVQVQHRGQAELTLSATRGDVRLMPHAGSHENLQLKIDTARVAPAQAYELHLVNADGAKVWGGTFSAQPNHEIVTKVPALSSGQYWVRIYRATDLQNQLQEYGLVID